MQASSIKHKCKVIFQSSNCVIDDELSPKFKLNWNLIKSLNFLYQHREEMREYYNREQQNEILK